MIKEFTTEDLEKAKQEAREEIKGSIFILVKTMIKTKRIWASRELLKKIEELWKKITKEKI